MQLKLNRANAEMQLFILNSAAQLFDKYARNEVLREISDDTILSKAELKEMRRFIDYLHQKADNYRLRAKDLKKLVAVFDLSGVVNVDYPTDSAAALDDSEQF